MNGKVEFTLFNSFSTLWFVTVILDRCIVYYIDFSGEMIILLETSVKVMTVFSFLSCSLIDIFTHFIVKFPYFIKQLIIYFIGICCVGMLLASSQLSILFFEIVYLVSVYLPLICGILFFFLSTIAYCKHKLFLVICFTLSVLLFVGGLVLYLFHNQDICDRMYPFFASEEIFALTTSVSIWLFNRYAKRLKEEVVEGKIVGEIEVDGEVLDVEMVLVWLFFIHFVCFLLFLSSLFYQVLFSLLLKKWRKYIPSIFHLFSLFFFHFP